jgi:hypothetical protein
MVGRISGEKQRPQLKAHIRLLLRLTACLALFAACTPPPETSEEALRRTIAQAGGAAEKRDLRNLAELLSDDYRDGQGRDREALLGTLRYYFLGHQSVYLLTRIGSVELRGEEQAQAVVLVALAGEPLSDPHEPTFLRASLYRFEFDFIREGGLWKVRQARWQPGVLRDFLPGEG